MDFGLDIENSMIDLDYTNEHHFSFFVHVHTIRESKQVDVIRGFPRKLAW